MNPPSLPSVLPTSPAIQDVSTTPEQLASGVGRVTNPSETPLYICAYSRCFRLFPSKDRLEGHRRTVHFPNGKSSDAEAKEHTITWNEY